MLIGCKLNKFLVLDLISSSTKLIVNDICELPCFIDQSINISQELYISFKLLGLLKL